VEEDVLSEHLNGYKDVVVKKIQPGIEDCFIRLLSKS
jgi:hypothetical protein